MSNKPQILLVDDDRAHTRGMGIRLRAFGYDVMAAHDGAAGLVAARENSPAAIVLDLQMPGMDGLTALAELGCCERTKSIPEIMVSGCAERRQTALNQGARYFLEKPYDSTTLLQALENVVDYPAHP